MEGFCGQDHLNVRLPESFWELSVQGLSGTDAFKAIGYDPNILGAERIHNTKKRIRKQGSSPEGIHLKPRKWMRTSKNYFRTAALEKMSHKEAAKRMQQEIVYLQQVEFSSTRKSATSDKERLYGGYSAAAVQNHSRCRGTEYVHRGCIPALLAVVLRP